MPKPARLPTLIIELQKAEALLLSQRRTTYAQIAEATGRSVKQARRYIAHLRTLGVDILDDLGDHGHFADRRPTELWIRKRSTKLFNH
jgi:hypothetical protein